MPTVQLVDSNGKKVKEFKVPDHIYAVPVKEHLLYESVKNFRANQRRGTASTKTRGEARGGGRKPWRQKGTGRARAGSIRSPIWKGGGVTFGPRPRDYSYNLPKKAKKSAMRSALSLKLSEKHFLVVDVFDLKEPKTKDAVKMMNDLNLDSALLVDSRENKNLFLATRNIPKVKAIDPAQICVYDVLNYRWLVLTQSAFDSLTERLK